RHVDPPRAPRPEIGRHVRTGREEAEDRNGECACDLARDHAPRDCLLERRRVAELERAEKEDRPGAEPEQHREEMDVENDVVRGQSFGPWSRRAALFTLRQAAARLKTRLSSGARGGARAPGRGTRTRRSRTS